MFEVLYITDSMAQAVDFINSLVSDLHDLEIDDIQHDKKNNSVSVGEAYIKGISIYGSCLGISRFPVRYFIDGIDMRNYEDSSAERLDHVLNHIKTVMTQFREETKQLSGKGELIEILQGEFNER